MPEEVAVIVVVAIIAGTLTTIVKQVFEYLNARRAESGKAGDSSLTTTELQRIVRAAVEEANTSMEDRFDHLEDRLDRIENPRLLPSQESRALDELDVGERETAPAARPQQRR